MRADRNRFQPWLTVPVVAFQDKEEQRNSQAPLTQLVVYFLNDSETEWSQTMQKRLCLMVAGYIRFIFSFAHFALPVWNGALGEKKGKKVTSNKAVNDHPEWKEDRERKLVFSRLLASSLVFSRPYQLLNHQPLVLSLLSFWWPFSSSLGLSERSSWLIYCFSILPFALVSCWIVFFPSFARTGISGDIKLFVAKVFC